MYPGALQIIVNKYIDYFLVLRFALCMFETNSNPCSTIDGAVGFPLPITETPSPTRSAVQTFRSLVGDLRRPLRKAAARRNGRTSEGVERELAPFVALPPEPLDLSTVDSKELLREILRRVGDDPDREGLQQTPDRIVRSWKEIYGGYAQRAEDIWSRNSKRSNTTK
jgi:hypothetical protein